MIQRRELWREGRGKSSPSLLEIPGFKKLIEASFPHWHCKCDCQPSHRAHFSPSVSAAPVESWFLKAVCSEPLLLTSTWWEQGRVIISADILAVGSGPSTHGIVFMRWFSWDKRCAPSAEKVAMDVPSCAELPSLRPHVLPLSSLFFPPVPAMQKHFGFSVISGSGSGFHDEQLRCVYAVTALESKASDHINSTV